MTKTMTSVKLTISIPTWNRAEYLKENLLSMLPQIQALPPGSVEIFISDNASSDATPDILAELSKTYACIRYIRQPVNQGANANFYTVLKEAQGDYIWLMGDDDHINPDSLPLILADIAQYQPGVMIGGTERDTQSNRLYLTKVQQHLCTDQNILLKYDGFELAGKMSVLIFSKAALMPVLESGWALIQKTLTPWPHLVWLFKLLAKNNSILLLPYTTNYVIEKNLYNLLQCGAVRLDLMFVEYTHMLCSVIHEFDHDLRHGLLQRVVKGRALELFKILAYATYLNPYGETIRSTWTALKVIPLWQNRLRFIGYYGLPALSPTFFRKGLFQLLQRLNPQWKEYHQFLAFLEEVKLRKKTARARDSFNKTYLEKD